MKHGQNTKVCDLKSSNCTSILLTSLALPVISVPPVKRPKLDSAGVHYSFGQEKELMRDKIRTALRIAVYYGHHNLVIGNFGLGPGFRNPPEEVAKMWRDAFLTDPEFKGHFQDIIFAFEDPEGPGAVSSSSSKSSSKSSSSSSKSSSKSSSSSSANKSSAASDLAVFRHVFKPSNLYPKAFATEPNRDAYHMAQYVKWEASYQRLV
jgi:hypothetical protein